MGWLDQHITPGRCFIIAEAGINHNGHMDLAQELVRRARMAGADCLKFQTFSTEACETVRAFKPGYFQGRDLGVDKLAWSRSLELTREQFARLRDLCAEEGLAFLSTACDVAGLAVLRDIGAQAVKIGSSDTTNFPLLHAVADAGMEAIVSTGMSSLEEVRRAVRFFTERGLGAAVLQCTSQYPAPPEQVNLRAMRTLATELGVPAGFSDHTRGDHVAVAAVAMGARIVEKHFTLSRALPGVDHAASLEPDEFRTMVDRIREVEAALGSGEKTVQDCERANLVPMRKSLVAARDIPTGTVLTAADLAAKRPGDGMPPDRLESVLGRRAAKNIARDEQLSEDALE